jgi:hypothetical protein
LSWDSIPVRLIICRRCPHGQRANDSGSGEKKRCPDSAKFSVHAIYKRVLETLLREIVLFLRGLAFPRRVVRIVA